MTDFNIRVGQNIEKAMLEENRSVRELANFLGFSKNNVDMYLQGHTTPSLYVLYKLSLFLGKKLDYFVGDYE